MGCLHYCWFSPGVLRALTALKFHQKYRKNKTRLVIFKNTISSELHKEVSEGIPVTYVESIGELKELF